MQGTEDDMLAAQVASVSLFDNQQHLRGISSVLKAETGLWLEFYASIFGNVRLLTTRCLLFRSRN